MRNDPVANSANSLGSPVAAKIDDVDDDGIAAIEIADEFMIVDPEASAVLHRHGHSSNMVPMGLSNRASWA